MIFSIEAFDLLRKLKSSSNLVENDQGNKENSKFF